MKSLAAQATACIQAVCFHIWTAQPSIRHSLFVWLQAAGDLISPWKRRQWCTSRAQVTQAYCKNRIVLFTFVFKIILFKLSSESHNYFANLVSFTKTTQAFLQVASCWHFIIELSANISCCFHISVKIHTDGSCCSATVAVVLLLLCCVVLLLLVCCCCAAVALLLLLCSFVHSARAN